MQLNKKIIFRYQNFKNKYIKNKSQIGKGNDDNDFEIIESKFNYKFELKKKEIENTFILKLLSTIDDDFPKTQFPSRMLFCEDNAHNVAALGSQLVNILPNNVTKNFSNLGSPSSLDAIIKIENSSSNDFEESEFEIINKLNYISDHNGIVLKLKKLDEKINLISFNLEGLCRCIYPEYDKNFEQRLELLEIHLRKYVNDPFVLICQEIVLKNKVNDNDHIFFLEDTCNRILNKIIEMTSYNVNYIHDKYTSGIFFSNNLNINERIEIVRKENEEIIKSSILTKKSNAYLINNNFWIVNIHLKALANKENHIEELTNIISKLFNNENYNFESVYLIGDYNHDNTKNDPTIDLVSSAMQNVIITIEEEI